MKSNGLYDEMIKEMVLEAECPDDEDDDDMIAMLSNGESDEILESDDDDYDDYSYDGENDDI